MKTYIIMSNVFNRGGIINERKINIKGCCKQLLDTYKRQTMNKNSLSFLRAKEREGEHGRNKIKNAK